MRKRETQGFFTRRALLLAGGKAVLLSALVGRMYDLQIVEGRRYALLADENRIDVRLLAPPRGVILDRWGERIATNDLNYAVLVVGERTPSLAETLEKLARILPLDPATIDRVLRRGARQRPFVPVPVIDNLTWEQVSQVSLNEPDLPGVGIEAQWRRAYPFGQATAHVVGYVAAVSEAELAAGDDPLLQLPGFRIGKSGIEKAYDRALRGRAGASNMEVNAVGRPIRELSRVEGRPGDTLVATIDMGLQLYVQQRLASETSASAVVLDIYTGEVLALASTPGFDPNQFSRGIGLDVWRALVSDPLRPLVNKAIAGQYAPGSTFKPITALAALEAGVSPQTQVVCGGVITLGRARFHCWKKGGHGPLAMLGAIRSSCDVYFYEMARRAGIDALAAMARRFGLGAPTGIDIPGEKAGLIPDSRWKRAALRQPWHPGETLIAGIGQGYITATPLQLAVMTARLANGGRAVTPRLMRSLGPVPGGQATPVAYRPAAPVPAGPSLEIDPKHLALVLEGMDLVCNDPRGTAFRVRIAEPGRAMAGKTGTAQVRRISLAERLRGVRKNEEVPYAQRDHALFIGFAPVGAPRYAAAVVVEHGGGGSAVAGPIARDILLEAQLRDPAAAPPPPTAVTLKA
ncbi:MAG: penicillin-binding protein 2 [Rhodospirillaceae bacterium]|nr:penicillin-binding protein 2 [Rhodospirillaceae bacterium]